MNHILKFGIRFFIGILVATLHPTTSAFAQNAKSSSAAQADDTVVMDKLVITASKFHWRYAKSAHFEILSNYKDDYFVASIIQRAELIIRPFEKNLALYRPNQELMAKVIFITNNGIERFFKATGIAHDTNPNKKAAISEIQRHLDEKYGTHSAHDNFPIHEGPLWSHSARNAEQMLIICTITQQFMDESGISFEKKIMYYGRDLACTYLRECLYGKNINPKTVLLDPFRGDFNLENLTWLEVNRNNITLRRYDAYLNFIAIKVYAKDEMRKILSSSNPELARAYKNHLLDRNVSDEENPNTLRLRGLEQAEFGKIFLAKLAKPVCPLRDIVEHEGISHYPERGSLDAIQKYLSFLRQATDFAYYCTFGPDAKTRTAFARLMEDKVKRPTTEEIFKHYFGVGYDEFSARIYRYFTEASKQTEDRDSAWGAPGMVVYRFTSKDIPQKVTWADATRSQSARIISDWFLVNKKPAIALDTLRLAGSDAPSLRNDPEFCAALGLGEMQDGDKTKALALLTKATDAKVQRPEAYRSLSRLRFENIMDAKGKDYKLTAAELSDVITPLYAAMKLSPSNPQTYLQFMEVIQHINDPLPEDFLKTLVNNCIQRFPDNFDLLDQFVPILLKSGLQAEASRLLNATAKCVLSKEEQPRLERLQAMVSGRNPAL